MYGTGLNLSVNYHNKEVSYALINIYENQPGNWLPLVSCLAYDIYAFNSNIVF